MKGMNFMISKNVMDNFNELDKTINLCSHW